MKEHGIITVIGKDKVGIIAKVSGLLAEEQTNIIDISQTILSEYFTMIMMVELNSAQDIEILGKKLKGLGQEIGVEIRLQHEGIFNAMHRI